MGTRGANGIIKCTKPYGRLCAANSRNRTRCPYFECRGRAEEACLAAARSDHETRKNGARMALVRISKSAPPESLCGACTEAMPNEDEISDEETTEPLVADAWNFYKVQKWTRDGAKVESLLYAGNSLGRARSVFERAIKHRPRIHFRQQTRVPTSTCRQRNLVLQPSRTGALPRPGISDAYQRYAQA